MKKINFDKIEFVFDITIFIILIASQLLGAYIPIIKTWIVDDVAAAITSTLIITIYLKLHQLVSF